MIANTHLYEIKIVNVADEELVGCRTLLPHKFTQATLVRDALRIDFHSLHSSSQRRLSWCLLRQRTHF